MAKKKEHSEWLITKGRLSRHQREQKRKRLIVIIGSVIITIVVVLIAIGVWDETRPEPPTLIGFEIRPEVPSVLLGETLQLEAVEVFDNGKEKTIKDDLIWTSSSTKTATISTQKGLATAITDGVTTISAVRNGSPAKSAELAVVRPDILKIGEISYDLKDYIHAIRKDSLKNTRDPFFTHTLDTVVALKAAELYKTVAPSLDVTVVDEEVTSKIKEYIFANYGAGDEQNESELYEKYLTTLYESASALGLTETDIDDWFQQQILHEKIKAEIDEIEFPSATELPQVNVQCILIDVTPQPEDEETELSEDEAPDTTTDNDNQIDEIEGDGNVPEDEEDPDFAQLAESLRNELFDRLDAGDDFSALAEEHSTYASIPEDQDFGLLPETIRTGDLGWIPKDIAIELFHDEFADLIFTIDENVLSEPISTADFEGNPRFWLVRVIDSDDSRQLSESFLNKMQATAFTDWLSAELENMDIEDYITIDLTMWAVGKVNLEFQQWLEEQAKTIE